MADTIQRALAGAEDFLWGYGSVNQTRNGSTVPIARINISHIPYKGTTAGLDLVTTDEVIQAPIQRGLYDFSVDGGAIGDFDLFYIPDNSTIINAWYEIITPFTSAGLATVALGIATDGAAEILDAKAFDDATWMTSGYHDTLVFPRAANFTTKTTAQRNVNLSIATAALTAGKMYVWCQYITSV